MMPRRRQAATRWFMTIFWCALLLCAQPVLAEEASPAGTASPPTEGQPAAQPADTASQAAAPTPASPESSSEKEPGQPRIRFDAESADLGRVRQGNTVEHVFAFHNDGGATLQILSVQPG